MLIGSAKGQFTALTYNSVSGAAGTKKTKNVGCQCASYTLNTIVFFMCHYSCSGSNYYKKTT